MSVRRLARSSWLLAIGFWLAALGLAFPTAASQQPTAANRLVDSARTLIDKSTPTGDVDGFRQARALLERTTTVEPNNGWALHYLGFALYREITMLMGRDGTGVEPLLERADEILERAARAANIPETHALRSGVLGMMIGTSPIKGMTLGPRSGAQMERALELGPDNPRVWLMRGIGAINTPAMFGGGLDKAEEYIVKSIALFSNDTPRPPAPAWGVSESHTWLGQVYAKQGKKDAARAEYQRALAIEPNDMWTKMVLLPALDAKSAKP
jgi:tetratricopeptide (TPR) repeat protein